MQRFIIITSFMTLLLEALTTPFMQRALLAGLLIAPLLGLFGVIVSMRKMSFFGEGIAHASLAGVAIALFAGIAPLPVSIAWACFVGALVYFLERKTTISADSAIGMLFTASMALGILIISKTPGYQPELMSYLFGNILSIRATDLWYLIGIVPLLFGWLLYALRPLTIASISDDLARVRGISTDGLLFIFYIVLAIALVLSVKVMGIILVSALLITPPAIGKTLSSSYKGFLFWTLIASVLMTLGGLLLSYILNVPSGATIVLVGTGLFGLVNLRIK
jgi:zinc transport system permease protein